MIDRETISRLCELAEPEVIQWRHHLHRHPELSFQEFETTAFIEKKLQSFGGFELWRPTPTGVVAILRGSRPGKVLAYRADIDALPIIESTENDPCSERQGVMHACGHDGHTAALLGIAKILSSLKEQLSGEYRLLFQPAEELPPGGAKAFVEAGVLDGVDMIFGMHLHPSLPAGVFAVAPGPQYATAYNFDIWIRGRGAHAAFPHLGADSVLAAAALIMELNTIVSRSLDSGKRSVLTVTKLEGGNSYNSMPEEVRLGGTIRTLDEDAGALLAERVRTVSEHVCASHQTTCQVDIKQGYPILKNDLQAAALVAQTLRENFGEERVLCADAVLGGEDFATYLQKVPGCFFKAGSIKRKPDGTAYPTHQSRHEMNDKALRYAMEAGLAVLFRAAGQAYADQTERGNSSV